MVINSRRLYYQVHGQMPPRKARRPARRGPARNWKYKAWIRTQACASCGTDRNVEAAHTGSDGGMRQKASDYSCIPCCTDCHTLAPDSYHRDRAGFERRVDIPGLVRELNHTWFAHAAEIK